MVEFVPGCDETAEIVFKIVSGWLLFMTHLGWVMFETGSIRYKQIKNIMLKIVFAPMVGFVGWWAVGWGFSLKTAAGHPLIGEIDPLSFLDQPTARWFFSGIFCTVACTIPSGSLAERCRVSTYMIYLAIHSAFVYPTFAYWVWSGSGFLSYYDGDGNLASVVGPAVIDFAGSGVIHVVGGVVGLIGAIILGPRRDRFRYPETYQAHNVTFVLMGTLVMWFAWFPFNIGSLPYICEVGAVQTAQIIAANTMIAPITCGLLTCAYACWIAGFDESEVVVRICNGILSGLVAITAGCGSVSRWEAGVIGLVAAIVYCASSSLLVHLGIDDPMDAFPVHGACGVWGVLAAGLFGPTQNTTRGRMFAVQIVFVLCTIFVCLIVYVPFFGITKRLGWLREDPPDDDFNFSFELDFDETPFDSRDTQEKTYPSNSGKNSFHEAGLSDSHSTDDNEEYSLMRECELRHRLAGRVVEICRVLEVSNCGGLLNSNTMMSIDGRLHKLERHALLGKSTTSPIDDERSTYKV